MELLQRVAPDCLSPGSVFTTHAIGMCWNGVKRKTQKSGDQNSSTRFVTPGHTTKNIPQNLPPQLPHLKMRLHTLFSRSLTGLDEDYRWLGEQ